MSQLQTQNNNQALIATTATLMPAMSVQQAVERYQTLTSFVTKLMKEDSDYGRIPGTDKATLLKPGAEKLTTFFGLSKRFTILEKAEDWTGGEHNGESFFYYQYRCSLFHGDTLVAEADGSCNSFESKYRWRKSERVCPECEQAAIIKGKAEYGGGWICFAKKGGCGAKFAPDNQQIAEQLVGRVSNPDICDQVNTIQKMSQKRALIAATLLAINASEFFTQDIEDFDYTELGQSTTEQHATTHHTGTNGAKKAKVVGADKKKKDEAKSKLGGVDHNDFWGFRAKHNIDRKQAQAIADKFPGNWDLALKELKALIIVDSEPVIEESPATEPNELQLKAYRTQLDGLIKTAMKNNIKRDEIDKTIANVCDGLVEIEQLDGDQLVMAIEAFNVFE